MKYVDRYGDNVRMMSPPVAGYRDVYSIDDDGRATAVDSVWGFWSETDRVDAVLFFDTPDDETYDLQKYEVMYEPREYNGE
jgi:hypothetical protein